VDRSAETADFPVSIVINGVRHDLAIAPWVTLLDLLRERMQFTRTKKGCDQGQCGACTVLIDGVRINSCLVLAVSRDGAEITTIEGLAERDELHPLQAALSSMTRSSAATAPRARSAPRLDCWLKDIRTAAPKSGSI
jgi:xanthine dehydrogenase YagT iron-sulfur-binding subunit